MSKGLKPILFTVFLLAFGMSFVSPLIPLMLKDLGASIATIGQIQTVYFIAFTITTFLLGRWIDRIGSKKIIITGLSIFGTAIFIMPLLPNPFFFYLIRIIQGIGTSFIFAPTETAINILSPPEKKASNMGLYGIVFAAGFAAGPALGSTLYSINTSAPFIFGSLSYLLAIAVLVTGFQETIIPVKKNKYALSQFTLLLKIPLAVAICYSFVEISIASFLSLFLVELRIDGTRLGIVFTCFALGGVISPYPAGKIADFAGKLPVIKFCGFSLAAVILTFNFIQSYLLICLLIFSVGMIAGALYPIALSLIGEIVPPEKMGTANATFSFFYGLGCISGPLITGWFVDFYSIKHLFLPMTASAIILMVIVLTEATNKTSSTSE